MATASSAQREPSMEEILASIRRIIEDSDPGRKQPDGASELKQDLEPAAGEKPEAEVETFRAELRGSLQDKKPFTLADVQAQIAAEQAPVERTSMERTVQPVRAPLSLAEIGEQKGLAASNANGAAVTAIRSADTIVADWRRDIAAAGQPAEPTLAANTRQEPVFDLSADMEIPDGIEIPADVEINEDELTPDASSAAVAVESGLAEEELNLRPAIVSEQTGRQVAAAFGELSEAFANRSKKSFDDMAQEMLRPMLQDWLDNNLPTLVERLVREEIERVARGT